jgi:redox-sensitive bicupin YhaK (pirin superfamily)
MSAGTGVRHSEFNPSATNKTHMLQIWIQPAKEGNEPGYEEKNFSREEKQGRLCLVASHNAQDGSVRIHQDASLYVGLFDGEEQAQLPLVSNRLAYVHVASGQVRVNDVDLQAGDAVMLEDEALLTLTHGVQAEVLVFDLPR